MTGKHECGRHLLPGEKFCDYVVVRISPKRWVVAEHRLNMPGDIPHHTIITEPISSSDEAAFIASEISSIPMEDYSNITKRYLIG